MQQNNKTWLWILLTVVITAVIVGGGMYYWQNKKATDTERNLMTQISNLQSQINTLNSAYTASTTPTTNSNSSDSQTVIDETANWKTYTSALYGWSMKYPNNYAVKEEGALGTSMQIVDYVTFTQDGNVAVGVTTYNKNITDDKFKTPFSGTIVPAHYVSLVSEDLTKLNSIPAIETVVIGPNDKRAETYYLRNLDNNLVSVGITNDYINNSDVEKMLSTFSF